MHSTNADVVLKNHVWVASDVLILKGSVIPEGSVIGARAVVSGKKFTKTSSVIAGNPARVVKENVVWEV